MSHSWTTTKNVKINGMSVICVFIFISFFFGMRNIKTLVKKALSIYGELLKASNKSFVWTAEFTFLVLCKSVVRPEA